MNVLCMEFREEKSSWVGIKNRLRICDYAEIIAPARAGDHLCLAYLAKTRTPFSTQFRGSLKCQECLITVEFKSQKASCCKR